MLLLITTSCQPSESQIATSISETQSENPTQTKEPTAEPTPTSAPLYSPEEQDELLRWCTQFIGIYYEDDNVRADVIEWIASQGTTVTENDVQMADTFYERLLELYMQVGELKRLPAVREINDSMGDALYAEYTAYDNLHMAYISGERTYFDTYSENKREAESLTGQIIDLFNDTMNTYDISPIDCTRY